MEYDQLIAQMQKIIETDEVPTIGLLADMIQAIKTLRADLRAAHDEIAELEKELSQ